jgi:hypothetical protein
MLIKFAHMKKLMKFLNKVYFITSKWVDRNLGAYLTNPNHMERFKRRMKDEEQT